MSRQDIAERQYLRERELTPAVAGVIQYSILKDKRGFAYAVFESDAHLFEFDLVYPHYFDYCPVVSFYGVDNAFFIGRLQ